MCPARGVLRVAGYEVTQGLLPERVTGIGEVALTHESEPT
jgi:hypothetical protein